MNKKWVTLAGLGVLLLGGGIWAYQHFTAKPVAASVIKGIVQKGDVRKVITATGTVNYPNPVPLTFNPGGKLVALNVNAGDVVKQGQVLAELDTSDLQIALQEAQANLTLAQANYQQKLDTQDSAILSTVSNAQQQAASTQKALLTAQQNADPGYLANQVNIAQQNLLNASNNLASAQAKAAQSGNNSGIQSAQTALTQAQAALADAQNQQNGGAAQALTQAQTAYDAAQANLAQAQAQLQKYQQGLPSTDLLSQQSSLSSAQTKLATAQKNLANAKLTAPSDGVIITVPVKNYQSVSATTTVMTLATGSNIMQVDTAVDQADISQVKAGQKADITLDAKPDQHISGTVTQVALQGTTTQNVTTYSVTVLLDKETDLLKAGMNANVNIILAEAKGVLTVPSEAIRGSGNRTSVLVPGPAPEGSNAGTGNSPGASGSSGSNGMSGSEAQNGRANRNSANGTSSKGANAARNASQGAAGAGVSLNGIDAHLVPVVIGLDDGSNVEIKSGLTEGQEIVVSVRAATATKASTSTGFGQSKAGGTTNPGQAMGQFNRATGGR
ncbi:MAG: HlyD family efflux transporter periplasmic adaptor subunit [Desulfitobacteriaceae bacterium]|nr:HlyD family efflux transporter periplasmic adaptor subunit [Desulfitobacteriaceae bacterium]MDI6915603.1 HlyD family efflux transporter periplasmic adaptor subunit [Desulfitobacteriaceae bacterium]